MKVEHRFELTFITNHALLQRNRHVEGDVADIVERDEERHDAASKHFAIDCDKKESSSCVLCVWRNEKSQVSAVQLLEHEPRDHAQQDNGTLLSNQTHARMRDETKRQQCSATALSITARHHTSAFTQSTTKQRLGSIGSVRGARDNDDASAESTRTPSRQRRDCRSPFVKLRSDSSQQKKTTRQTRARIGSSRVCCVCPCALCLSPLLALANGRSTSCTTSQTTYTTRQRCATTARSRAPHN